MANIVAVAHGAGTFNTLVAVVSGKLMAADVLEEASLPTVQGQSITVSQNGSVKVDNATVVTTDIDADNGVIHVIDSVILPQ